MSSHNTPWGPLLGAASSMVRWAGKGAGGYSHTVRTRSPWCRSLVSITRVLVQQCDHRDALRPDLWESAHQPLTSRTTSSALWMCPCRGTIACSRWLPSVTRLSRRNERFRQNLWPFALHGKIKEIQWSKDLTICISVLLTLRLTLVL